MIDTLYTPTRIRRKPFARELEKNLEERGTSDCDVGAVHAVQAPPENGEAQHRIQRIYHNHRHPPLKKFFKFHA